MNLPSRNGNESAENMFGLDPSMFNLTPSASGAPNPNLDLDNILGGSFTNQFPSGTGLTPAGMNGWGASYSPYSEFPFNAGTGSNQWEQNFEDPLSQSRPDLPYFDNRATVGDREDGYGDSKPKRKAEDMALPVDDSEPKPKKKRGPRKRKEKSAEEKQAKELMKLKRNREAASKCRDKKKKENAAKQEVLSQLERHNKQMKAALEELTAERNSFLGMLSLHKDCRHADVDACLEFHLSRVQNENLEGEYQGIAHSTPGAAYSMARTNSQGSNASQNTVSSHSTHPGSHQSLVMSRESSDASHRQEVTVTQASQASHAQQFASKAPNWNAVQSMNDQVAASHQERNQSFSAPQEYQQMPYQDSPISGQGSNQHRRVSSNGSSDNTPVSTMSRQSSQTSISQDNGDRSNKGSSTAGTPAGEQKRIVPGSIFDQAEVGGTSGSRFSTRKQRLMANQRVNNSNNRPQPSVGGPSDLSSPAAYLAGLERSVY